MSIQLTIDEMLEILEQEGSPVFNQFKGATECLAMSLARAVQVTEPRLVWSGSAHREPLDFAGTCAQFSPREVGPVPACLLNMDVEVQQWQDMCLEMAEKVLL